MALTRPRAAQIYDIDYKQATRVVTVSNITLSGGAPSQVDGVNLSLKDRVLVTGQSTASQNGIYYVTTLGSGSNGTWSRSLDTNDTGELLSGTIVMVTEGTIYADTQWKITTNDPITVGVTDQTWVQNYSANSIASGNSNVTILTNANVLLSSTGTANVVDVFGTGIKITGTESVTGNITGGNLLTGGLISATGNITGNYFLGNVFYANGITASKIYSGTSEVNVVSSGGNVNVTVGGTSNVAVFATTGEYVTGLISASGNVTGGNLLTDGLVSAAGNITGGNVSGTNLTGTNVSVTGTATAASTVGGVITGSSTSVTGGVTAASVSGGVITGTSASVTGTVTAASTVGGVITGSSASVTGNVTGGNLSTTGAVTTGTLTTTGNAIIGGNLAVNGNVSYINITNLNVQDPIISLGRGPNDTPLVADDGKDRGEQLWYYKTAEGSAFIGWQNSTNKLLAASNVSIANEIVTVNQYGTFVAGTYEGNVVSVNGNVTGGNLLTGGIISATGNITGGNVSATSLTGTTVSVSGGVTAASVAGGVITGTSASVSGGVTAASVSGGVITGTSASVSGNVTGGNVLTAGIVSATGNVSGNFILGNGSQLTGLPGGTSITNGTSNVSIGSSGGNVTVGVGGTNNIAIFATTGEYVTGVLSASGNVTGDNVLTGGLISATGNITGGNILTSGAISTSGTVTGASTVGGVMTGSSLSVTGAVTAASTMGGVITGSSASVTGTVTAASTVGGVITGSSASVTGTVTGASVVGGVMTGSSLSVTGAVTAASTVGGIITGSSTSVTGTTTAASVVGGVMTGTSLSVSGNVTGNYILGNGSQLTGINAFSTVSVATQDNIVANSIASTLTIAAGNNISLTTSNVTNTLTIAYTSSGGSSIFATGGDMGLVTEAVTSSEDLGTVIDAVSISYDLGTLGVTGVVSNSDIIANTITGDKINSTTYLSITGNITAANLAIVSSTTDVRGWWYASKTKSVSSQETNPTGITLDSATGTKMYVAGTATSSAYQYTLSTGFDASTATYASKSFSFVSQDNSPQDIQINTTATTLYMLGGSNKTVYQYSLTGGDISTATYGSLSLSVSAQETTPKGLYITDDGANLYVVGSTNQTVYQYTISAAGNVASGAYASKSFSISAQDSNPVGISMNAAGTIMWIAGANSKNIYQYTLSDPYNVSSAIYYGPYYQGFQQGTLGGMHVNITQTSAYLVGSLPASVFQYSTGNSSIATANSFYLSSSMNIAGNVNVGNLAINGNLVATQVQSMMYALAF